MKVATPHLGNLWVVLKTAFEELGVEYVVPPFSSRRTLSLGVRYSPETVCLPFKITLGNFYEALEKGAELLIMPSGRGLCRFGYYAILQERILKDLGFQFEMIKVDLFGGRIFSVLELFKKLSGRPWPKVIKSIFFGLAKMKEIDEIEKLVQKIRAREIEKGTATRIFREAIRDIERASDFSSLRKTVKEYKERLLSVPQNKDLDPLKVGLIGEFYILLEPFSNMDIEIELGKLGVEVRRSIYISHWTKFSLFLALLKLDEKARLHRAAMPYLSRDVGGDGWETVGHKVLDVGRYDGLIHVAPFTCMPEIVACNILPSIKTDIPLITLIFDEQMGKAGMMTRIEAFVDLLKKRREAKLRGERKAWTSSWG